MHNIEISIMVKPKFLVHFKFFFNRHGEIPQDLIGLEGRNIVWIVHGKGIERNNRQSSKVVKFTEKPEIRR